MISKVDLGGKAMTAVRGEGREQLKCTYSPLYYAVTARSEPRVDHPHQRF